MSLWPRLIRGLVKAPSLSHKNMTTTVAPSGSGEPSSDLDETQPGFDVYQAYQRALADEEVSLTCPSNVDRTRLLIQASRYLPL
jgi:hypothetical protein